jgi:hypothetical protein
MKTNFRLKSYPLAIIPTIVIPFTALLAALSALATFNAGLFGFRLKAEGPKKLLEVMLKPRVLIVAILCNLLLMGGYKAFFYFKSSPMTLWRIQRIQVQLAKPSTLVYPDEESSGPIHQKFHLGKIEVDWTRDLGSGSFRGATVSGDSLFVGLDNGLIHELDAQTGATRREFFYWHFCFRPGADSRGRTLCRRGHSRNSRSKGLQI